jgi:hypothetical protein
VIRYQGYWSAASRGGGGARHDRLARGESLFALRGIGREKFDRRAQHWKEGEAALFVLAPPPSASLQACPRAALLDVVSTFLR